jgi:prepilin-type N-terminal cleavage/methylation domain-containing protein
MKNKKGFTLIEVIGAVIILGILAIIAIPFFTKNLEDFRADFYSNMVDSIKSSGVEFFTDNRKYRPTSYLEAQTVPLKLLMDQKYIDEILDYEGTQCSDNSYVIVIKKGKDEYDYHVCLKCPFDDYDNTVENNYCSSVWKDEPKFKYVLGNADKIYIYKGTDRDELRELTKISAWKARVDSLGNELDRVDGAGEEGVPLIYPTDLDVVDVDKVGKYTIHYKFNDEIENVEKAREVEVYENDEPVITITKTNIVHSGAATSPTSTTTSTTAFEAGSDEWAQKLTVNIAQNTSKPSILPILVAKLPSS